MIKAVSYAYPTSTYAAKFGRSREGCYFVCEKRCEEQVRPSKLHGPFATRLEAFACADDLPHEWSRFTMERA